MIAGHRSDRSSSRRASRLWASQSGVRRPAVGSPDDPGLDAVALACPKPPSLLVRYYVIFRARAGGIGEPADCEDAVTVALVTDAFVRLRSDVWQCR